LGVRDEDLIIYTSVISKHSNSKFKNSGEVLYRLALSPALSQVWERAQDLWLPFSQNWEKGLGDES
jgi:hypothetical protein